ncbi:hypothetical protein ScPMuIL_007900 [Solemya velum]
MTSQRRIYVYSEVLHQSTQDVAWTSRLVFIKRTHSSDQLIGRFLFNFKGGHKAVQKMNAICTILRQEFRLKNLGFTDVHPKRFATFQWRVPHIVVLIYRLLHAIYVDFWLIYTATKATPDSIPLPWAAYLTSWTYFVLSLYSTLHLLVTLFETVCGSTPVTTRRSTEEHNLLFTEHHSDSPLWASGEYLPISDDETDNMKSSTGGIDEINLQLHGINTVIIVLEHLLSAVPVRLLHCVYPIIFGLVYVIFSAIYWGVNHDNVMYPGVLDWNSPSKTVGILFLVALVVIPFFHIAFFILHKLKLYIHWRVSEESP